MNWENPEDISGIKRTWYKLGSAPTSPTDGTFITKPFNVTATVENGQVLYVWLEDNAGNKDYNNSSSIELRYETIPPIAPKSLKADNANPSPWKKTPAFSINWEEPEDISGIKGAWYKLGVEPTSDTDGAFITNKLFDVRATAENGQTLYVWLEDNAGNRDYNVDFDRALSVLSIF
ncbi:MAG: hypothetical protein QME81_14225 [bacterium]|nr:hypothetical protein [bacterium]